jgi:hypothetical protein
LDQPPLSFCQFGAAFAIFFFNLIANAMGFFFGFNGDFFFNGFGAVFRVQKQVFSFLFCAADRFFTDRLSQDISYQQPYQQSCQNE